MEKQVADDANTAWRDEPVLVVGAGVIGLSCARALLLDGFSRVTVVGDKWSPDTTSDGAGALWERRCDAHAALARDTLAHYEALAASSPGGEHGVAFCEGASWSHDAAPYDGFVEERGLCARAATPDELAAVNARARERYASGLVWRSAIVDSPAYMAWLTRDVAARGGRLVRRALASLRDAAPAFRVAVNATGLGARALAHDGAVYAARGQVIRVYAPHVTRFTMASVEPRARGGPPGGAGAGDSTYVLPRPASGVVTCGGTYQAGREDTGIDEADRERIWADCVALEPALADARTVRIDEWAGLRPARTGDVRIELQELPPAPPRAEEPAGDAAGAPADAPAVAPGAPPLLVVHAYGHGGCGHSLGWGTALRAAALCAEAARRAAAGGPPDAAAAAARDAFVAAGESPLPLRTPPHVLLPRLARLAGAAAGL